MSRRASIPTSTFTSKAFERLREEDNPGYERRSSSKKTDDVSTMLGYGCSSSSSSSTSKRTSRDNDEVLVKEDTKAKIARIKSQIEALQAEAALLELPEFAISKFLSKVHSAADPSGKNCHVEVVTVEFVESSDFGFPASKGLAHAVKDKLFASLAVKLEPTKTHPQESSTMVTASNLLCRLAVDTILVLNGTLPQKYAMVMSVSGMATFLRNLFIAFVKSLPGTPKTVLYPTSYRADASALVKLCFEHALSLPQHTALEPASKPYLRLDKAIDQVLKKLLDQALPNQTFAFTNRYEVHFVHDKYETL